MRRIFYFSFKKKHANTRESEGNPLKPNKKLKNI
jgi:hypothetical protein